jgi:hypothetical protein
MLYIKSNQGENQGTFAFQVTVVYDDATADATYKINNQSFNSESADANGRIFTWLQYTFSNNMSIAQENPWLSFFMNLIPTLLLLGVMV